jgi:hypothetical protein
MDISSDVRTQREVGEGFGMGFSMFTVLTPLRAESPIHYFAFQRPLYASILFCTVGILIKDSAISFA